MSIENAIKKMLDTSDAEEKAAEIRAKVEKSSPWTTEVVPNHQNMDNSTGIYLPDGSINPNAGIGG